MAFDDLFEYLGISIGLSSVVWWMSKAWSKFMGEGML
jgi:hypothetical protein